jgi:hypothetical protein
LRSKIKAAVNNEERRAVSREEASFLRNEERRVRGMCKIGL